MKEKLFISTPIYYVNWKPHIWHVYASLIADSFARMKRSVWFDVKFTTWADENSQKTVEKAQEKWQDIQEYLDEISQIHENTWKKYQISYTDFVRTSSSKHAKLVENILNKTKDNWYIYKWKYDWLFCDWCEAFKKDSELIERDWKLVCPDHLKEPKRIEEENYFFKLKDFEWFLKNLYKENKDFVVPSSRYNEVKSFVNEWVEDFSISREWKNFWIKFPFDGKHVVYVWYDALFSYYTTTLWDNLEDLWYFWKNIYHVIWKEIAKFHSIYRPAMLNAVNMPLPKKVFTTWFFTVDWQKMSKSLWNVIDPIEILEKYNRDAISLYLFYDIKIWKDWDFSFSRFEDVYNNILIWGLWNLSYRVWKLAEKFDIKQWKLHDHWIENKLLQAIESSDIEDVLNWFFEDINYQWYLKLWHDLVQASNKFLQDEQPWSVIKEDKEKWVKTLETAVWLIHKINLLWSFFLIEWFEKICQSFKFKHFDTSVNFDWFFEELCKDQVSISPNAKIVYEKIEELEK